MANSPLRMENIIKHMAEALPTHPIEDTSSDLSSIYEAIALFCHSCMIALDFRLVGFKEEQKIEAECRRIAPRLPEQWNTSLGSYSFLYAHSQSSMQYLVKVDRMGSKADIRGIALGSERIERAEITAKDYVSSAVLPLRITVKDNGEEDRSDLNTRIKNLFISPSKIQELAVTFNTIIKTLIPGLNKEGYEITSTSQTSRAHDEREHVQPRRDPSRNPLRDPGLPLPARPYPFDDPLAAGPRIPVPAGDFPPPGFDDEYDLQRPLRGFASPFPGAGSPFSIGHDDLNPPGLGPYDPLRGSLVGGGGVIGGRVGSGGMHPTFDDPLFTGSGPRDGRSGGRFNPQVPPGARYDPLGPGDGPQRGAGGRPPNPFGSFGSNDFM